jgi:serine protease Do
VLVSDVTPGSPGAKAGLARGDVITAFDGVRPSDSSHLRRLVAEAGKDKTVTVQVLRDGKLRSLDVKLGEQPSEQEPVAANADGSRGFDAFEGVEVQELDPGSRRALDVPSDLQGVLVSEVKPGSRAEDAGLKPGDVILEVNRVPTPNLKALRAALKRDADKALLLVQRRGMTVFMLLSK